MPPATPTKTASSPREKLFWALVASAAAAQLAALWMLCSQQVRQAEVRAATVHAERMALADCLRFIPQAVSGHCAARIARRHDPGALLAAAENTAHLSAAASVSMRNVEAVSLRLR